MEQHGCLVVKQHGTMYSKAGVSDLLCCIQGKFVAIEVKIHPNKPTKLQEKFFEEVRECGGVAIVAYSIDDVKNLIVAS